MNSHALMAETGRYTFLRNELLRRFPSLVEDDQALADTLDGISDLDEAIAAVAKSIEDDEIMVAGIAARKIELTLRENRIRDRMESKEGAMLEAMERAGKQRIELPTATIFLARNPQGVVVTNETLIPDNLMVQPDAPPKRPDKKAIAELLKGGKTVAGCELSNASRRIQWNKK